MPTINFTNATGSFTYTEDTTTPPIEPPIEPPPTQGSMPPPAGYTAAKLVKSELFKGPGLDTSYWTPNIGDDQHGVWNNRGALPAPYSGNNAGGNQAEYYDPAQVDANNGLTITAVRSTKFSGYSWKSGHIRTTGKKFPSGYVQVRAKCPDMSKGAWPAIWMLPQGNPTIAEIDICDLGFTPNPNQLVLCKYFKTNSSNYYQSGVDLPNDYHIFGFEFKPGQSMKWYLDGKQIHSTTNNIESSPTDISICLQMAASSTSGWHSAISNSTPEPVKLQVSEMQIYKL